VNDKGTIVHIKDKNGLLILQNKMRADIIEKIEWWQK
jgi:hypothetical protein